MWSLRQNLKKTGLLLDSDLRFQNESYMIYKLLPLFPSTPKVDLSFMQKLLLKAVQRSMHHSRSTDILHLINQLSRAHSHSMLCKRCIALFLLCLCVVGSSLSLCEHRQSWRVLLWHLFSEDDVIACDGLPSKRRDNTSVRFTSQSIGYYVSINEQVCFLQSFKQIYKCIPYTQMGNTFSLSLHMMSQFMRLAKTWGVQIFRWRQMGKLIFNPKPLRQACVASVSSVIGLTFPFSFWWQHVYGSPTNDAKGNSSCFKM